MTSITTLRELRRLGPHLCDRLGRSDYLALCHRLHRFSEQLCDSPRSPSISRDLESTLERLEERIPELVVHVRGSGDDKSRLSSEPTAAGESQIAAELKRDFLDVLANLDRQREVDADAWLGQPEVIVFDRLPRQMRERATRIRDWCEDRLEFIHSRGQMRYYTAHGIGHSKRVLRYGVDLLRAFEPFFADPVNYFIIYAAAFCHDLGLMYQAEEDPESDRMFEIVRTTHGKRMWELIIGSREHGLTPAWQAMGFANECEALQVANVAATHSKSAAVDLSRLPSSQAVFVDGDTRNASPFALASLFRLADALDCNEKRLPPEPYLKHSGISNASIREYLRHELVEDVHVSDLATINVAMRIRYKYPDSLATEATVRGELETEIACVRDLLGEVHLKLPEAKLHLKLPEAKFNSVKALFLEDHPFWHHSESVAVPSGYASSQQELAAKRSR